MANEKTWSHQNLQIKEGLKPGSKHFQYFFLVSEEERRSATIVFGLTMRTWQTSPPPRTLRRSLLPEEKSGAGG